VITLLLQRAVAGCNETPPVSGVLHVIRTYKRCFCSKNLWQIDHVANMVPEYPPACNRSNPPLNTEFFTIIVILVCTDVHLYATGCLYERCYNRLYPATGLYVTPSLRTSRHNYLRLALVQTNNRARCGSQMSAVRTLLTAFVTSWKSLLGFVFHTQCKFRFYCTKFFL
jgi:hypothetical protein